jgi:hypothetical protein
LLSLLSEEIVPVSNFFRGTIHQGPMEGIDNWFYARVRNHGSSSAQHFMDTFTVKPWAATEFVYPANFIPCTAATGGFEPTPDAEKIVSVKWPAASIPPAGTHACPRSLSNCA